MRINFATPAEAEELYVYHVIAYKMLKAFSSNDEFLFSWSNKIAGKFKSFLEARMSQEEFDQEIYMFELSYLMDEFASKEDTLKKYGHSPLGKHWFVKFNQACREVVNELNNH
jgi:hypothetical protein